MAKHLHELIVFSEDLELINSPAFYDCIVHLICKDGFGHFSYNDRHFEMSRNDIAVISRPQLVSAISQCNAQVSLGHNKTGYRNQCLHPYNSRIYENTQTLTNQSLGIELESAMNCT